jgi:hypothetical protein
MARNLDARHHYFSCKRAYSEAQKALAALQARPVLAKADREYAELAAEYSERAMIDAHLDWAQAEREALLAESPTFAKAFGEMMRLQKAAEKAAYAYSQLQVGLGLARQVAGDDGSEHHLAEAFVVQVNEMLTGAGMFASRAALRELQQRAAVRGAAVSKLFDAHLEGIERMVESEVA